MYSLFLIIPKVICAGETYVQLEYKTHKYFLIHIIPEFPRPWSNLRIVKFLFIST